MNADFNFEPFLTPTREADFNAVAISGICVYLRLTAVEF
jgi:hypothetical protein